MKQIYVFTAALALALSLSAQDDSFMESGTLRVVVKDNHKNRRSETSYQLVSESGVLRDLSWEKPPKGLHTGQKVKLELEENDEDFEVISYSIKEVTKVSKALSAAANVEQKILVVPIGFSTVDNGAIRCTKSYLHDLFYPSSGSSSVIDLYKKVSRGALSFEAEIADPVRLGSDPNNSSPSDCKASRWSNRVDAKLAKRGIKVKNYQKRIYVFPYKTNCNISGFGEIGDYPGNDQSYKTWIWDTCQTRQFSINLFAHEIGHNLGLHHANALEEDSDRIIEYADSSDFMSFSDSSSRLLNGVHTLFMGFLPLAETLDISSADPDNIYKLSAVNMDPENKSSLRVLKVPSDQGQFYFISYRGTQGYDSGLASQYLQKVSIHKNADTDNQSVLIRTLSDHESFFDPQLKMSVRLVNHTDNEANVSVKFDPTCRDGKPLIDLSKRKLTYNLTPDFTSNPATFNVAVTNTDEACLSRRFKISVNSSLEINTLLNEDSVELESGKKKVITVNLFPVRGILPGRYPIDFTVSESNGPKVKVRGILDVRE